MTKELAPETFGVGGSSAANAAVAAPTTLPTQKADGVSPALRLFEKRSTIGCFALLHAGLNHCVRLILLREGAAIASDLRARGVMSKPFARGLLGINAMVDVAAS